MRKKPRQACPDCASRTRHKDTMCSEDRYGGSQGLWSTQLEKIHSAAEPESWRRGPRRVEPRVREVGSVPQQMTTVGAEFDFERLR